MHQSRLVLFNAEELPLTELGVLDKISVGSKSSEGCFSKIMPEAKTGPKDGRNVHASLRT